MFYDQGHGPTHKVDSKWWSRHPTTGPYDHKAWVPLTTVPWWVPEGNVCVAITASIPKELWVQLGDKTWTQKKYPLWKVAETWKTYLITYILVNSLLFLDFWFSYIFQGSVKKLVLLLWIQYLTVSNSLDLKGGSFSTNYRSKFFLQKPLGQKAALAEQQPHLQDPVSLL